MKIHKCEICGKHTTHNTMDCNVNVFFKTFSEHCMSRDNMKSINMKKTVRKFKNEKCKSKNENAWGEKQISTQPTDKISRCRISSHLHQLIIVNPRMSENANVLMKNKLPVESLHRTSTFNAASVVGEKCHDQVHFNQLVFFGSTEKLVAHHRSNI